MQRPWRPMLAAVMAVWFLVLTMEPRALHVCPMHGAANAGSESGHAGGSTGHHHAATLPRDQSPDDEASYCTCLGVCNGVSPVAVVPAAAAPSATVRVTNARPGRPQHEYMAGWVDFVLPFATAPPTSTS